MSTHGQFDELKERDAFCALMSRSTVYHHQQDYLHESTLGRAAAGIFRGLDRQQDIGNRAMSNSVRTSPEGVNNFNFVLEDEQRLPLPSSETCPQEFISGHGAHNQSSPLVVALAAAAGAALSQVLIREQSPAFSPFASSIKSPTFSSKFTNPLFFHHQSSELMLPSFGSVVGSSSAGSRSFLPHFGTPFSQMASKAASAFLLFGSYATVNQKLHNATEVGSPENEATSVLLSSIAAGTVHSVGRYLVGFHHVHTAQTVAATTCYFGAYAAVKGSLLPQYAEINNNVRMQRTFKDHVVILTAGAVAGVASELCRFVTARSAFSLPRNILVYMARPALSHALLFWGYETALEQVQTF